MPWIGSSKYAWLFGIYIVVTVEIYIPSRHALSQRYFTLFTEEVNLAEKGIFRYAVILSQRAERRKPFYMHLQGDNPVRLHILACTFEAFFSRANVVNTLPSYSSYSGDKVLTMKRE
jgi:hypothetical protein